MLSFLKYYFAALFAGATFFLLCFLVIVIMSSGSKDTSLTNDSVLHIKLSGNMVDYVAPSTFPIFDELIEEGGGLSMESITGQIRKASKDDRIEEIYLEIGFFNAGTPQLREIRSALQAFQDSGKIVRAYGQVFTRGAYYLASAADSLYLNHTGAIEWNGLGYSSPYLKGALDKIGVKIQLIRGKDNDFKSAAEPLIAEHMSEENRLQTESYLNSIWDEMIADLEKDGRLTAAELDEIAGNDYVIESKDALELGMVDALVFEDEVLAHYFADSTHENYDNNRLVSLSRYKREPANTKASFKDQIAVIYAEGEINLGESTNTVLGSETLVKALRKVRTDDNIKAIVLRINSPGGVSLAADQMWREVELAAQSKPLVVSMGNVAASGGYLIAAPADQILVQPQTVTGSIGVFGIFPVADELLNDHLGIHFESVGTHTHSTMGTPDRPLNEAEYAIIQHQVDVIYDRFKQQVAQGRGLERNVVDSLARGRVWTGAQAVELGLADDFGGLNDAIQRAKSLAEIEGDARLKNYPQSRDPFSDYYNMMQMRSAEKKLKESLGPLYSVYRDWVEINAMSGLQQRMLQYNAESPF